MLCEIFSGKQPWHSVKVFQHFRDWLCPHLHSNYYSLMSWCRNIQMANLSHAVYRKTAHTDLYLHSDYQHCPGHAKGCSVHCHALHWCCDDDSLEEEIENLKQTFKNNCKSSWVIQQTLHTKDERQTTTKKPAGVSLLPYHSISN